VDDIFTWQTAGGLVLDDAYDLGIVVDPAFETELLIITLRHHYFFGVTDIGLYLEGDDKDTLLYWAHNYPGCGLKLSLPNYDEKVVIKVGQGDSVLTPIYLLDEEGNRLELEPGDTVTLSVFLQAPALKRAHRLAPTLSLVYRKVQ
jgi:hypothetical protein